MYRRGVQLSRKLGSTGSDYPMCLNNTLLTWHIDFLMTKLYYLINSRKLNFRATRNIYTKLLLERRYVHCRSQLSQRKIKLDLVEMKLNQAMRRVCVCVYVCIKGLWDTCESFGLYLTLNGRQV